MKIGIVCYPTYGGSGVVATELGKALAKNGNEIHFITYSQPTRLDFFSENLYYHEVAIKDYPLFDYPPYELALASKMVDVVEHEKLDVLHVHYAIPHASAAHMAKQILAEKGISIPARRLILNVIQFVHIDPMLPLQNCLFQRSYSANIEKLVQKKVPKEAKPW